jgi:CBS-domain-containing membrane protein
MLVNRTRFQSEILPSHAVPWTTGHVDSQLPGLPGDYVRSHSHHVADVMTRTVVTAEEHTDLREIARLMQRHRVRRVPIVHDGKVVGMISRANLLRGLSSREPFPVDGEISDENIRAAVSAELETILPASMMFGV